VDFINGNVPLPPRFRERGPEFAWSAHVRGWRERLAVEGGAMVDFGAALADPVAAVKQLLRFCSRNNTASTTQNEHDDALHAAAVAIAAGASRERTVQLLAGSSDHPSTAVDAEHHFPGAGSPPQQQEETWTADFSSLPPVLQRLFEHNADAAWEDVRGSSAPGAKWGPAAVMAWPSSTRAQMKSSFPPRTSEM
jgi:hypothetical protein